MTTKEKIKIMQAFEQGEEIEARANGSDVWLECKEPEPQLVTKEELAGKWVTCDDWDSWQIVTGISKMDSNVFEAGCVDRDISYFLQREGAVYNDKPTMDGARDFYGREV